jgi:hypothetical protein
MKIYLEYNENMSLFQSILKQSFYFKWFLKCSSNGSFENEQGS